MIYFLSKKLHQDVGIEAILECINSLLFIRNLPKTLGRRESTIIVHSPISYEVLQPCLRFYNSSNPGIYISQTYLVDIRYLVFTILQRALKLDINLQ